MIVKFVKTHKIGIQEGVVKKLDEKIANRFIEEGYAKKSNEKEYKAYLKKIHPKPIIKKVPCKECEEKPKGKKTTVCKECEEKRLNKK